MGEGWWEWYLETEHDGQGIHAIHYFLQFFPSLPLPLLSRSHNPLSHIHILTSGTGESGIN